MTDRLHRDDSGRGRGRVGRAALVSLGVAALPIAAVAIAGEVLSIPAPALVAFAVVMLCLSLILFGRIADAHRYEIDGRRLLIRSPGGSVSIPLSHVTGIRKVRRARSGRRPDTAREHVEITYLHPKDDAAVTVCVTPAAPLDFVHDVVRHCPHLSEFAQQRLIRTDAFREAETASD